MASTANSSAQPSRLWKVALLCSLLMTIGLTALLLYLHTPHYQASGLIMIDATALYIAYPNRDQLSLDRYIETQRELILSPVVLAPVSARPKIAKLEEFLRPKNFITKGGLDPIAQLQENLTINQVGSSDLYEIKYTSSSAQGASDVVNAVFAEYLAIQSGEEFRRAQRIVDILEEERRRRSLDVERLRQKVLGLALYVTGEDPFTGVVLDPRKNQKTIARLHERVSELGINRGVIERKIQHLRKETETPIGNEMVNEQAESVVEYRTEFQDGQAAIEGVVSFLKSMTNLQSDWGENAEVVDLMNALPSQQAALEKLKQTLQNHLLNQRSTKQPFGNQQSVIVLERELEDLNIREKVLTEQLDQRLQDMEKVGDKSVELEFAKAELAREEHVFELIATRKLRMQTELRAPTRVRLRQKAATPSRPSNQFPYRLLIVGCLIAFAVSYAIALACRLERGNRC